MVDAQYLLLKSLGVTSLATISGASMGGMQALQWMVSYPEFVRSTIPIACSARMSAMNLAVSEISRAAIVSDPEWKDGNYYGQGFPSKGLALARMATHLTYVSSEFLEHEFGQQPWDTGDYSYRIGGEFKVQEYLRLEGEQFVERFDANSFLYLSQAMEYFDLARKAGSLVAAFSAVKSDVLLLSFSSDWLFPVPQLSEIEMALKTVGVDVRHVTVQTSLGHDAFLTDWRKVSPIVRDFLSR
jgi:homoserine O-acetyltransferase